jgi:hypothetical protein
VIWPAHVKPARRGAAAALLAFALGAAATPARAAPFTETELPLPKRLYDLGVAYVDGDPVPDLFTTAHNNRQVVLIGDGDGGFEDRLSALRLDHTPAFPGLEAINNAPDLTEAGLYLFYRPRGLRLLAHEAPASGELRSRAFRKVVSRGGASARLKVPGRGELARAQVSYKLPPGGRIDVKMTPLALPVRVVPAAGATHVGSQAVATDRRAFSIELRDRHGIGWADLDADGDSDAFIVRGGLAGRIKDHPNLVQDELLVNSGGRFSDLALERGLRKGSCRGRDALPVDADGDARTDLSASCKKGAMRLFLRDGRRFANASGPLRRAGARGGEAEWVDIRGSVAPELMTIRGSAAELYRLGSHGAWARVDRIQGLPRGEPQSVASADFDNDGDADVVVSKSRGIALLENVEGALASRAPGGLGLPSRVAGPVAWVDHQNDGLLDLYAPPGGIYEQQPGGSFAATGQLATGDLTVARSVWTDVDGDGDRDGVLTGRSGGDRITVLNENRLAGDHWLQVDVGGRGGAREAPGARVSVRADGRTQTAWVGQSDSSRFSSGEWRTYFGLGAEAGADRVTVRWTDGLKRTLANVAGDQLLRVERP